MQKIEEEEDRQENGPVAEGGPLLVTVAPKRHKRSPTIAYAETGSRNMPETT